MRRLEQLATSVVFFPSWYAAVLVVLHWERGRRWTGHSGSSEGGGTGGAVGQAAFEHLYIGLLALLMHWLALLFVSRRGPVVGLARGAVRSALAGAGASLTVGIVTRQLAFDVSGGGSLLWMSIVTLSVFGWTWLAHLCIRPRKAGPTN